MPPSAPSTLREHPLPEVTRRALDGGHVDTKSLRGKVVVVKFFAKFCEPCKRTLPAVERLHEKRSDVAFIGIAEDEHESESQEVVTAYALSFSVVHDAGQVLSGRFHVSEMPTTFVADKKGIVRWVGVASQTEEDLERAVTAAGESPP
jgi:peroxiredoxin